MDYEFVGAELACVHCGSTNSAGTCSGGCGEMVCVCQHGKPCPACQQQQEYDEEQQRYEAEREERLQFEADMEEKYHRY